MFAYCGNNPANNEDAYGNRYQICRPNEVKVSIADFAALGVAIGAVYLVGSAKSKEDTKAESSALFDKEKKRDYTVYFLSATDGATDEIVYVGRVKTANYDARMAYHRTQGRSEKWRIDGLTWLECRGLEQVGMAFFHTINKNNSLYNQIRGVSPTNTSRSQYFVAAKIFWRAVSSEIDAIMPFSYWENWTENEILNGGM